MTPVAAEGTKPSNTMGVARRQATGQVFLTNQIVSLCGLDPSEAQVMDLLPTPAANIGSNGGSQHPDKRRAGNHQPSIQDVAEHVLMPTPRATRGGSGTETMYLLGGERSDDDRPQGEVIMRHVTDWGPYAPAIHRWERALGRPAPSPTEPNSKGKPRLSPRFCEWLMGTPEGWITDTPGVSRNDQLKACGNGVVPAQAAAAIKDMLRSFQ